MYVIKCVWQVQTHNPHCCEFVTFLQKVFLRFYSLCTLKKNDVQNILAVAPPIHPANAQFAEVFGRNNVVELQCSIHVKKHCKKFFLSGPTTCAVSSEFGLAKYFLQRYGELYEVFLQSCLSSELVVLFCLFLVQFRMYLQRRKYFVEELEHVYKWEH